MPEIKDKVVVITGASSGIGEAGFQFGMWTAECGELNAVRRSYSARPDWIGSRLGKKIKN